MADFKTVGTSPAEVVAAGGVAVPRTTLLQTLITSDEELLWNVQARVFMALSGTLTTPETVTATALVRQQPQIYVRVPAGYVIIPLMACVTFEATGAAVNEVLVSAYNNDIGTGNSTAATAVCTNTRYGTKTAAGLARATVTGNTGTAGTGVADLFRSYMQADQDAITGAPTPPIVYQPSRGLGQRAVVGGADTVHTWAVHLANGTSSTAFVIVTWAEFTYAEIYGA